VLPGSRGVPVIVEARLARSPFLDTTPFVPAPHCFCPFGLSAVVVQLLDGFAVSQYRHWCCLPLLAPHTHRSFTDHISIAKGVKSSTLGGHAAYIDCRLISGSSADQGAGPVPALYFYITCPKAL